MTTATRPLRPTRDALTAAIGALRGRDPEPQVRIALAEALFRLAVTPGTAEREAVELVREAITNDPCHPKLYLHLGRLLHRCGRYRCAVREYRRALALAPSSRRAHLLLAQALLEFDPPEQEIGRQLLAAVMRDSADERKAALADLDAFDERRRCEIAGYAAKDGRGASSGQAGGAGADGGADARSSGGAGGGATRGSGARRRAGQRGAGSAPPADGTGWQAAWRVSLFEQISREKPSRRWVDSHLRAGVAEVADQGRVAELATACVLMLATGENPRDVRRLIESAVPTGTSGQGSARGAAAAGGGLPAGDAALDLVNAGIDLAETADGVEFVGAAARHVAAGTVPVELVAWLHFSKFGPDSSLEPGAALRLLDKCPQALQQDPVLGELKLATLDGYARLAWADGNLDLARLLWKETIPLDPYRVPVALNLALLAARARSHDEYQPAWDRMFELLYLHAAGAGDVQYLLADRRMMHAALCQQSLQRHFELKPGQRTLTDDQAAALAGDPDALEVWLREWDRYYLNARLGFRSPVRLFGVPRDASEEDLGTARQALERHVEIALGDADWAGLGVFRELTATRIGDDFPRACDMLERARDRHYELEKADADALADEALDRGVRLRNLMHALAAKPDARHLRTGAAIARRQLVLPWTVLQPICVDRGLIDADTDLVRLFEDDLVHLVADCWDEPTPGDERAWSAVLRDVGECVAVLAHRIDLRMLYCSILFKAGRYDDAYTAAVEALKLPHPTGEAGRAADVRAEAARNQLANLLDAVAFEAVPEALRKPKSIDDIRRLLPAGLETAQRYPASTGLRILLANRMVQLREEAESARAVRLLEEAATSAVTAQQRAEIEEALATVREAAVFGAWLHEHVEAVVDQVKQALQQLQDAPSRSRLTAARTALRQAVGRLEGELETALAERRQDRIDHLEQVLGDLRGLERQLPAE